MHPALPEEVALKVGYSASQRVINFILQDKYASREIEIEAGMPTRGGCTSTSPAAMRARRSWVAAWAVGWRLGWRARWRWIGWCW